MSKLTYKWVKGNDTKIFNSFSEVEQYVKFNGGSYAPIYETIYDDKEYNGSHPRRKI